MINALLSRIAELERKIANMMPVGPATEVDAKSQTFRMRIGGTDEKPQFSPWAPYSQQFGKLKIHAPISKGQNMLLLCPNGDPQQAVGIPLCSNNANPSPSDKDDENVIEYGEATIKLKGDEIHVKRVVQEFHFKPDGGVEMRTGELSVNMDAGSGDVTVNGSKIVLNAPVVMPKGFSAGGGKGAAVIDGSIEAKQDITSGTKIKAPVIEGAWVER